MAITAQQAAKTFSVLRDWNVSNLELQKLLYMAHMVHLGENGEPLLRESFEAWDYGPVVPSLYHHLKGFGADPVGNVFHGARTVNEASPEFVTLADIEKQTREFTPGRLVAVTHWEDGAWARTYRAGQKGLIIRNSDIREEYERRTK